MSLAFVCVRVRVWNDGSGKGSVFLVACVAFVFGELTGSRMQKQIMY